MPIAANHVQFYKATVNDDTPNNGGLISTTLIADGVKNNIFPDASKNERLNGSTKYRKAFLSLRNPDSTPAIDVKLFVLRPTQAVDSITLIKKGKTDTQSSILSTDSRWGAGFLLSAAAVGVTTITVAPEQSLHEVFESGDTIAITTRNESNPTALVDYYIINAIVADGVNKVITLNRGLDNAMPAGAVVSSCITKSTFSATATQLQATATFDFNQIVLNNAGTVDDSWGLVFTSATEFSLYQLSAGMTVPVATGNIGSAFSPINSQNNQPFFTMPTTFFNGTYAANNILEFTTSSADQGFFIERIIPAGTDYAAGNSVLLAVELESA